MSFYALNINCPEEYVEIFMAELAEVGFSTFQEKEDGTGLLAYGDEGITYAKDILDSLFERYQMVDNLSYTDSFVEKENWNADWEKNYDPITVGKQILVRADFHPSDKSFNYEIIVTPKMSFGTGHHETTHQLLAMIVDMDIENKQVLDAGCGTGILGILAAKKQAKLVHAYDIDEWAVENTVENFALNNISSEVYNIWKGDVHSVGKESQYEIILANINRNILLEDIQFLNKHLVAGGKLLLSGFYEGDIEDILAEASKFNLSESNRSLKNNWAALCLSKNL